MSETAKVLFDLLAMIEESTASRVDVRHRGSGQ
jgi:hypothetical protein